MTSINIPTAQHVINQLPDARDEVFKKAILYALDEGKSNCYVLFRANDLEIFNLQSLGYKAYVSDNGATHISWYEGDNHG